MGKRANREIEIARIQERLLRHSSPRLEMILIISLAGAAGFFSSIGLLHLGLTRMVFRYPLAVIAGYCVFLLLLRIWISIKSRSGRRSSASSDVVSLDLPGTFGDIVLRDRETPVTFGGGSSGGGGASDSWASGSIAEKSVRSGMLSGFGSSGGGSSGSSDSDLEGLWLVILALLALVGALAAAIYVVYAAPALFAEILFDSVLMAGLYKKLQGIEPRFWMMSAFRRTYLPVLAIIALCTLAGYFLQQAAPDARTIGDVFRQEVRQSR